MVHISFFKSLGFALKDNSQWVYQKLYHDKSRIEIDVAEEEIRYCDIACESKTTSNFSMPENFVVLECVNRLLEKGYYAKDLILEKTYKLWHVNKWRLDILVQKDGQTYLMIECKTWGKEFDKELKNIQKDGWQLFSYFQQDRTTQYLVLYASNESWEYCHDIITIEDSYRETSNVKDLFDRWNKFTKQNGIFDQRVQPYHFESRALTLKDLKDIQETDASFIFNRFLEILRHNTVSDKPNAFNKIFTLFLCKIHDEWTKRDDEELEFQWKEWVDSHVSFQMRLTDLYKKWMVEFLSKEITDFNNADFNKEFGYLDETTRRRILEKITKIRLQKNNEFAIKEVFDDETFDDNAIVLKEIVELLQQYRVRYTKKQPFLGDFFELLLTTGLKQESGQFFTPVPIARFICKAIPIKEIIEKKLHAWDTSDLLPTTIDYAAWSWHFLTESMEEIQNIINSLDTSSLRPHVKKQCDMRKAGPFDRAVEYIYWIEKDYRLVKTAKVWCYLHGDGVATIIHGDGLDSFEQSKNYKGKLKKTHHDDKQENGQFDFVLSNPPYSVSSFKGNLKSQNAKHDFDLFDSLTDASSEIEALFIERTKQLLKEWWIAAIILPSSILSNTWIYTKAREIILKYFDIVSIVSFGSNTFMATGTNTVTLFLKKRNKYLAQTLTKSIDDIFMTQRDVSLNQIENVLSTYISHVWWRSLSDYLTLLEKQPNAIIMQHELYTDYTKKIKIGKNDDIYDLIIHREKEKMLYFVLAYHQTVILVKSWEKQEEKEFLWYEFSFRKGSEGIHPIQGGKQIDDCTKLFDPTCVDNPQKVSTYIYEALQNNTDRPIHDSLTKHVMRVRLVDMMIFDRADMEKTISLNVKKKVTVQSKWEIVKISDICDIWRWRVIDKKEISANMWDYPVYSSQTTNDWIFGYLNTYDFEWEYLTWTTDWANAWAVFYRNGKFNCTNVCWTLQIKQKEKVLYWYLLEVLKKETSQYVVRVANPKLMNNVMAEVKIPLPPLDIQQKIVDEIGILKKQEHEAKKEIAKIDQEIEKIVLSVEWEKQVKIWDIASELFAGWDLPEWNYIKWRNPSWEYTIPIYSNWVENDWLYGFINKARVEKNCVTISARWTIGYPIERKESFYPIVRLLVLIPKDNVALCKYLVYVIKRLDLKQFGATTPQLTVPQISDFKIPLPPLEIQQQIVSQIDVLENQKNQLEQELASIPTQKHAILKNYL